MTYTLSFNHPHFPEGTEFNVGNLGRVPNGGSIEIDEETERLFLMSNGVTLDETFANDHAVELAGSSSLDKSEVDEILTFFAPVEEEEEVVSTPVVEEEEPEPERITPSFLTTEGGGENA